MIRDILRKEIGKCGDFKVWWNGDDRGDYSINVVSKEMAEKVKRELADSGHFSKIDVVGSFVNFYLSEKLLEKGLKFTLQDKFNFWKGRVQVEFISANPTGPLTLGNGRGGVYGDVLANVLTEAGFSVTKEYYINDVGNQINILGHSVLKNERAEYKGKYIDELAGKIKSKDPTAVGQEAAKIILEGIKKTVSSMGIEFDVWFSEKKELREKGKVEEIMDWLKNKGLTYERGGALWFRATEFGDSEDRVLIKKDGEPTYFGVDCAYHKNKFLDRKFDKIINIWGADHHGDVARVKGFVEALGFKDKFEIILMQFVRLVKEGGAVRMSKREGVYILIDDILKEVGRDAFRYFMLTRSPDTHMDFDMDLAKEQSKKNPVYYVQYAGARMSSILEKSNSPNQKFLSSKNFGSTRNYERKLILKLIQFPEIIEDIAKDYQVHRLTIYIYELAKTFTDFYENVRVLNAENEELKKARLSLVFITRQTLERALSLLGISAPKKM
jgi:arginyl-tRNA synthetase